MTWTVETLGPVVDAEIESLPKDMQAAFGAPHVKHLHGKLWEMRLTGRDGIARAIYVTAAGRRLVVVHAFVKKSRKTPRAALDLAEQRAKEIQP